MIAGLLVVDLLLFALASTFQEAALNVNTWGTYGDWASAVLPTAAILITVGMWVADQRRDQLKKTAEELAQIALDVGGGYPRYLRNRSIHDVWIVSINGTPFSLAAPPGTDHQIPGLDENSGAGYVDVLTNRGERWRLRSSSPPQFVSN